MDALAHADHLQRRTDGVRVVLRDAGNEAIRVTQANHHGAVVVSVEHEVAGLAARHAPALAQAEEFFHVVLQAGRAGRLDDLRGQFAEVQFSQLLFDHRLPAEQDRLGDLLLHQAEAGAQNFLVFAFREDNALGRGLGLVAHALHHLVRASQPARELLAVLLKVDL